MNIIDAAFNATVTLLETIAEIITGEPKNANDNPTDRTGNHSTVRDPVNRDDATRKEPSPTPESPR